MRLKPADKSKHANATKEKYMVYADVILHSFDETEKGFEVIDIDISEKYYRAEYGGIIDLTHEYLSEYGEIIADIHRDLWEMYNSENCYKLHVGLNYKDERDCMTGEINTEVNYGYEIVEIDIDIVPYLN